MTTLQTVTTKMPRFGSEWRHSDYYTPRVRTDREYVGLETTKAPLRGVMPRFISRVIDRLM